MSEQQQRRDRGPAPSSAPPVNVQAIMTQGATKAMTDQAEAFGRYLATAGLTTAQIRNIFGTVRTIEMTWQPQAKAEEVAKAQRQLIMLKPKMAYQAKRIQSRSTAMADLAGVLGQAIDMIGNDRKRFQNFVDLFEAILAYHTAEGGRSQ
jgi:CRISPR-associated protein Csm2